MKIIAITQKGINKSENEDRIVVGKSIVAEGTLLTEIDSGVLAVADGVGGNNAGSVASHFVANKLCALKEISAESLAAINEELLQLSYENTKYNGMATTLSGILLSQDNACLFSIGNSRVYLLQSRKYLKQLTADDTILNYLLTTGQLALAEAEKFDRKNEITACFGGGSSSLFIIKISNTESLSAPILVTSDGIHDYLNVDQMEDIIGKHGISVAACETMVTAARGSGSLDDISILLGDM